MSTEPAPTSSLLDQLRSRIQVLSEQAVQERDGLSGERDQLVQERDGLSGERDQLAQERDGLRGERDRLVQERDGLSGERDQLAQAFLHVFPYAIYRDRRPDLASMNDQQIAEHFACHGIREGVSLEATVIADILLKSLQEENQTLQAKQDDLEALITDYTSRLSVLQDLFVKLSLEGRKG